VRIFQLAQELNVSSQEILDALDDMGIPVKSNLAALDDAVVAELRELFKPKPKTAVSAREEAIRRALKEKEERERAAREAARREAERKAAARRAALERAARLRALEKARAEGRTISAEELARAEADVAAEAAEVEPKPAAQAPPAPEPPASAPAPEVSPAAPIATPEPPATEEKPAEEPAETREAAEVPKEAPAAKPSPKPAARIAEPAEPSPPPEKQPAPATPARPAPPTAPAGPRLGKAVVAPPPTTAKERAELLGKRLSQLRAAGAGRRAAPATPSSAALPARGQARRPQGGRRKKQKSQEQRQAPRPVREAAPEPPVGEVKISEGLTIKDLAERMNRKAKDIIKKLFLEKKIMATINHALDEDTARWIVEAFGGTPVIVGIEDEALAEALPEAEAQQDPSRLVPRPPVVTMMGHVDHGKTSLLDAIREARVAEREAGGITQHIGAYKVKQVHEGTEKEIVFLDTPGHEAFTLMRARGARVTDIVVLVVAADDGVMPQTLEAIDHAKAAGVPLVVAVNKIDKPGANPDRVLQQLAEHDVLVEQFGGDVVAVFVSAKTREGLDQLLDMILLVAEMLELKADPERPASGTVLEAKLDRSRGPVATVLVQNGTLRIGDVFVVGASFGKVRALMDENGKRLREAGPATPVVVMGLEEVPQAGDTLQVFPDEHKARQIALYRQQKLREEMEARRAKLPTLELLHKQIAEKELTELPIVLKADVQGSVEALRHKLEELSTSEVKVNVIHAATGAITETDVMLAAASRAIIVGFNVRPQRGVPEAARREGVDIRLHTVIYKVTDEIRQAMLATLSPVEKEVYLGRAEVRQVFRISRIGTVAGCYVVDGVIQRDANVRLLRDHVVIHEGRIASLKRFKDDAREVRAGFECGISLEKYNDIKPGDEIEAFKIELVQRESLDPGEATTTG